MYVTRPLVVLRPVSHAEFGRIHIFLAGPCVRRVLKSPDLPIAKALHHLNTIPYISFSGRRHFVRRAPTIDGKRNIGRRFINVQQFLVG
jgi:hypothetical protein